MFDEMFDEMEVGMFDEIESGMFDKMAEGLFDGSYNGGYVVGNYNGMLNEPPSMSTEPAHNV